MTKRAKILIGLLLSAIVTACTIHYKKVKYKSKELKIENKFNTNKSKNK